MTMEEMSQCLKIRKEIEHIEEMLEAPSKTVIVFFKDYRLREIRQGVFIT